MWRKEKSFVFLPKRKDRTQDSLFFRSPVFPLSFKGQSKLIKNGEKILKRQVLCISTEERKKPERHKLEENLRQQ